VVRHGLLRQSPKKAQSKHKQKILSPLEMCKSLILSHAPSRNRTYNPVIKSLLVLGSVPAGEIGALIDTFSFTGADSNRYASCKSMQINADSGTENCAINAAREKI